MAIIAQVGRKSTGVRLLIGVIYVSLIAGAAAMVYPFLLLLSGSVKSAVDVNEYDLVPRYLYDTAALHRKYVEEKYGYTSTHLNNMYRTDFGRVEDVTPPAVYSTRLVQDWREFMAQGAWPEYFPEEGGRLPLDMFLVRFYVGEAFRLHWMHMAWQDFLEDRYGTVAHFNQACSENRENFQVILPYPNLCYTRRYRANVQSRYYTDFLEFKAQCRERNEMRFVSGIPMDGLYATEFVLAKYGSSIADYNATHGTQFETVGEIRLEERVPDSPRTDEEWRAYIADPWRVRNVRLNERGLDRFRVFLAARYGSAQNLAQAYGRATEGEAHFEPSLPAVQNDGSPAYEDLLAFLRETAPWDDVYLQTVDDWAQYVRTELGLQFVRVDKAGVEAFRAYLDGFYTAAASAEPGGTALDLFALRYDLPEASAFSDLSAYLAQCELPQPMPPGTQFAVDFDNFLREACPLDSIRLVTPDILFAEYLKDKYGTLDACLDALERSLAYPLGDRPALEAGLSPLGTTALEVMREARLTNVYALFDLLERDPAILPRTGCASSDQFRAALSADDTRSIAAILDIDAWDARRITTFRDIATPERARDWEDVQAHRGELRLHYLTQNYRQVLRAIVVHGRALANTIVFVLGSILLALIVNPLAAYALARYELPSTYKVLLFFMATMAFPAEVTMIPNFLLLKNFPVGYLLQGAILFVLFFGARALLKQERPRVWTTIETAVILSTGGLLAAAFLDAGGGTARWVGFPENGYWHYILVPALAAAAVVIAGSALPRAWAACCRKLTPLAWVVVLSISTLLATPIAARAFGFSPSASLLNTFWALLLPGMANGFSIFLLKGFFDSLPKNLYESAQLEGASEIWIFRNVTLPLSKPILAVIALQTFTLAYTTFIYAFLVCQDERMWTLMVYIYQMQIESPHYVVFASLVIAALPTLLVFIFAQRVIMRGIIIPVEK